MKEKIKKSLIPILICIILFPSLIIYSIIKDNETTQDKYDQELNGIISSISLGGKGSYKIDVKQQQKKNDSVYFLGLGYKAGDILVNDSIAKKKNDRMYYIYRKKEKNYYLVYIKELRGKFFKKWD